MNLGRIVSTADVNDCMTVSEEFAAFVLDCLARHTQGDWGDIDVNDRRANEEALKVGTRVMSVYKLPEDQPGKLTLWIITEADRSSTTVLWPSEY